MDDTIQSVKVEERIESASQPESLKTSHSGGRSSTSLTKQDIERLEGLTRMEALAEVREELANLLIVYQNLGGKITAISLPPGKEILAHQHILVLPANKTEDGAFFLSVPE